MLAFKLFVVRSEFTILLILALVAVMLLAIRLDTEATLVSTMLLFITLETKLFTFALTMLELAKLDVEAITLEACTLLKFGLSLSEYVTLPKVSVDTFKFVEDAKNLYRPDIEVVALTPLIVVVITPSFAEISLELIMEVVAIFPLIIEVSSFITESNLLSSTN